MTVEFMLSEAEDRKPVPTKVFATGTQCTVHCQIRTNQDAVAEEGCTRTSGTIHG
jgi:hypothetical protein